jgi:hypothetical protein
VCKPTLISLRALNLILVFAQISRYLLPILVGQSSPILRRMIEVAMLMVVLLLISAQLSFENIQVEVLHWLLPNCDNLPEHRLSFPGSPDNDFLFLRYGTRVGTNRFNRLSFRCALVLLHVRILPHLLFGPVRL